VIDWSTLEFGRLWPLALCCLALAAAGSLWYLRQPSVFPDIGLIDATRSYGGLVDRGPIIGCVAVLLLLTASLMNPSVIRSDQLVQHARDFVILVDTSRSMRHDTQVRRDAVEINYQRRAGAFLEAVDEPDKIPFVARFELARESLFRFLSDREPSDRVAVLYFNDDVHPVSALTRDLGFITEQLAGMDDFVNWGTDIAAVLSSALGLLEAYPDHHNRTVILMTDAETRFTEDLEQQFRRLAEAGLSFYLLWITTDSQDLASDDATAFLNLARSAGTVITIENPDADNLRESLLDIGRVESYRYVEERRSRIDLAAPIREAARLLLLPLLLLLATVWRPLSSGQILQEPRT
jgi:Mg-chelatase subunit ChlD